MAWGLIKLLDGRSIPEIGFGSWLQGNGQTEVDNVEQAIEIGFNHIDTAQTYRNEEEVGQGIKESGEKVWLTTKWSGTDNKSIRESINDSLTKLKVKSVDLYLIHSPRLVVGHPLESWKEFESLKKEGLVKSIGVSNYRIPDLELLREAGLSTPVVNQILLHPYVYAQQKPLLEYQAKYNIITEAYSTLIPITQKSGGPVDLPLSLISKARGNISYASILFAWARSKGAIIVTTSSKKERLEDYLKAGDLELTVAEIESIDLAGASNLWVWRIKKNLVPVTIGAALFVAGKWFVNLN